jgi:transposase
MEERLRFVARRLEGESMTALCREFGISRKTGHKLFARWKAHGLEALADRPRRPGRVANRLPMPVEATIVALRRERPTWGARKLRELLARRLGPEVALPARSTIHAVLDRHGLVEQARAHRPRATGTPLSDPAAPNDLWCCDFKGEFRLGNGRLCYPLTVTDQASRFVLMVEALEGTAEAPVFTAFHRLFPGARPARRHPVGQRCPLRQPRALRALAPRGLVAAASNRRFASGETSGSSASPPAGPAERPPRAHAPHSEAGDHPSGRRQ